PFARKLKQSGREIIICGDVNIAHRKIDLKNWRGNQKNSGFLPEERAWMDKLFASGFVDIFRELYPEKEAYTWWSNRGRAREKDVGWRIDYQIATLAMARLAQSASIHNRLERFSDHAPLILDYQYEL
ncbi:MAG: exodeoxyribonuclease III, partial [Mariprofundaceae bacterium]